MRIFTWISLFEAPGSKDFTRCYRSMDHVLFSSSWIKFQIDFLQYCTNHWKLSTTCSDRNTERWWLKLVSKECEAIFIWSSFCNTLTLSFVMPSVLPLQKKESQRPLANQYWRKYQRIPMCPMSANNIQVSRKFSANETAIAQIMRLLSKGWVPKMHMMQWLQGKRGISVPFKSREEWQILPTQGFGRFW